MICARSFTRKPRFARPVYYITFASICQGVFEKFFKKFFVDLSNRFLNSSCGSARLLYHIFLILSRGFSKVFSTFFVIFLGRSSFQKRPTIISHLLDFVKRFLKSFLKTFSWFPRGSVPGPLAFGLRGASRSVLAYYSTSLGNCQGVFRKFFHFGVIVTLS